MEVDSAGRYFFFVALVSAATSSTAVTAAFFFAALAAAACSSAALGLPPCVWLFCLFPVVALAACFGGLVLVVPALVAWLFFVSFPPDLLVS